MTTLRFAPSPNGRLHLGHAYSALLNAALAERLGGTLLLRIEDIDPVRSRPELIAAIHDDLAWLGLRFDGPVRRQSEHLSLYARALGDLAARRLTYPCFCSRKDIAARIAALGEGAGIARDPDGTPLYPGTCRALSPTEAEARIAAGDPHTWRLDMGRALATAPGPHRFCCLALPDRAKTLPLLRGRVPAEQAGEGPAPHFPEKALTSPDSRSRAVHSPSPGCGLHGSDRASHPDPHPEVATRSGALEGALQKPQRSLEASFEAADAAPPDEDESGVAECEPVPKRVGAGRGPQRGEGVRTIVGESDVTADPSRWGDAVIARRDVPTSYHLSVVLDDDAQGVTHVVRGQDLEAATDLHVLLQRLMGLGTPTYRHHGLIREGDGRKLAKSRGSESLADLRARGVSASEVRAMLGFGGVE